MVTEVEDCASEKKIKSKYEGEVRTVRMWVESLKRKREKNKTLR